jgi:RNA-directed DNA polymerase
VEKRLLGIPAVVDRVMQAAVRMTIEPIFENRFAKQSYGFPPPGCGCKEALRRFEELLQASHTHVVDVDIKGNFDAIPHQRLMALVREDIAEGRVLGLIEEFLKQGVIEGAQWQEAKDDTP